MIVFMIFGLNGWETPLISANPFESIKACHKFRDAVIKEKITYYQGHIFFDSGCFIQTSKTYVETNLLYDYLK